MAWTGRSEVTESMVVACTAVDLGRGIRSCCNVQAKSIPNSVVVRVRSRGKKGQSYDRRSSLALLNERRYRYPEWSVCGRIRQTIRKEFVLLLALISFPCSATDPVFT